ncbi:PREDICTED: uncharacterized protein LOC101296525 [Fragaria vesca subsp. vesca]|uniref:uncharacterized protein LOC101296525 n=1 Tax=Fragaria vesca subsp. vesca TaxID=101020 RepID=UPI0002C33AFC|nr:PREDICTED: uncharacterized protein LOC101296525 [Fragaria vesca subsp. vesca]
MEYVDEVVDYSDTKEEVIHLAPAALDDTPPQVRDPISQVDVGTTEKPLLISISAKLAEDEKETLLALLCEYRDCFADKYEDMPGLSPVCHRLPTYPDRRPVRQDGRFMRTETQIVVKEEIESMHRSGIIRVAKYNEWLSNVVPVRKKNGKMRVCVDYRDLNNATPKDIYPMPVADLLIDAAAGRCYHLWMERPDTIRFPSLRRIDTRPLSAALVLPARSRCKLRHYMLAFTTVVIAQSDLVKYMLSRPILRGRIGKWILAMSEFSLQYVPQKAVKGQAIADFLAHHPLSELTAFRELEFATVTLAPWTLYFDGSRTDTAAGAGIAIANPAGDRFSYSFQLDFKCTNNQAEYEALIIGLEILLNLGVREVQIFGDSLLVVNQLVEKFKCLSSSIEPYLRKAFEVLDRFDDVYIEHIPREFNFAANELAQVASGLSLRDGVRERLLKVERRTLPSFIARGQFQAYTPEVAALDPIDEDWRLPFIAYLQNPNDAAHSRQIRFLALNFVLRNGELRRRGEDGNDFRCVYGNEAKRIMREVHCGVCGSHQAGPKMRWLIRRYGYYWPTILKDCIAFAKGCQDCQAHGPVQHIPNIPLQPIIKPWSGRGWAIDFVGIIHPHSSEQHKFIIVATDFFTKWVEAEPLKVASANSVRNFIFRNIISRFGIPECIVTDRGAAFMADSVVKYLNDYGIKLLHSTPYYAQSNGQAEASN